jgi:hypothetical protein
LVLLAEHGVENELVHNPRNNGDLFLLTWEDYLKTLNIINIITHDNIKT